MNEAKITFKSTGWPGEYTVFADDEEVGRLQHWRWRESSGIDAGAILTFNGNDYDLGTCYAADAKRAAKAVIHEPHRFMTREQQKEWRRVNLGE